MKKLIGVSTAILGAALLFAPPQANAKSKFFVYVGSRDCPREAPAYGYGYDGGYYQQPSYGYYSAPAYGYGYYSAPAYGWGDRDRRWREHERHEWREHERHERREWRERERYRDRW